VPERALRSKFEVGEEDVPALAHIPWSYGQDRVTAMVVDPETLFAYWEVREDSIEDARRNLGPGGPSAWLNLRFYDITNRIFDGTNAHRYFDVKIERSDRHWFRRVGQPESTWCVEIGMMSYEGYFQRIARSGRADFPRRGPSRRRAIEWMTVQVQTGEMNAHDGRPSAPTVSLSHAAPPAVEPQGNLQHIEPPSVGPRGHISAAAERHHQEALWVTRESIDMAAWEERHEIRGEWTAAGERMEWQGPVTRTEWRAGPFFLPIEAPVYSEERRTFEGPVRIESFDGKTRVVYGPWQVVIRGIGGHAEHRVLARWQIEHSWVTETSREQVSESLRRWSLTRGPGGASESAWFGASERLLLRGSENRLLGASELYLLGASERMWGGASELLVAAASEWLLRGASERRLFAVSEQRLLGASEWLYAGASERLFVGASEFQFAGASEAFAGASEGWQHPFTP
jgi:hypothetical protein